MNRFRTPILLLFTVVIIALVFFGAQLQVPTALAFPTLASFNMAAPTANTCAVSGCHTGTVSTTAATIFFGSGTTTLTTYTPGGPAIPVTVTIPATTYSTWGFQLSARMASNVASQAGNFNAGDNGTTQSSGGSSSFTFNWTPPPAGTTDGATFYLSGTNTSDEHTNNVFSTGMATLGAKVAVTAPVISSLASTTFTVGTAGMFQVTASGSPTSYAETGTLPTGVTFSTTTGALSGTPAAGSNPSYAISFTATNAGGTSASQAFTLTVKPATVTAPVISSLASTTFTVGTAGMFQVTASGSPTSYAETGTLPTGVTFSTTTGALSGTPAAGSNPSYAISFTATNAGGTSASQAFTLTVKAAQIADFSLSASPNSLTIAQGASGTSTIKVTDLNGFTGAVGLGASGMPTGVMASFAGTTLTLTASSTAATGNSTVNITGTSGTTLTHSITLSLTVSGTSSGGALTVSPMSLTFNYQIGGRLPGSRTLALTSTGGSTSFTAKETDPWLSIAPASGTITPGNPGSIRASVNPAGMAPGTYGAQININGTSISVSVSLIITSGSGSCDDGCGGTSGHMYAQPYVSSSQSGTLAAAWVDNMGATPLSTSDPLNRGLVLSKAASAPADALAGATIQNVTGMNLTELGFYLRTVTPCGTDSPQFLVVTTDGAMHTVGGCTSTTTTPPSPAPNGWLHLQFDPAKAGITTGVKSISLAIGKGPTPPTGSIAVIDNIEINGVVVGKGTTSTSTSRDN